MCKALNRTLIILFLGLVGLFLYKTINKPSVISASLSDASKVQIDVDNMNEESKEALHAIIKDYIINHPEDIIKSLESLQNKKMEESAQQVEEYIKSHLSDIENDDNPPIIGNEKGDIKIVVFYDYNCSFCKIFLRFTVKNILRFSSITMSNSFCLLLK